METCNTCFFHSFFTELRNSFIFMKGDFFVFNLREQRKVTTVVQPDHPSSFGWHHSGDSVVSPTINQCADLPRCVNWNMSEGNVHFLKESSVVLNSACKGNPPPPPRHLISYLKRLSSSLCEHTSQGSWDSETAWLPHEFRVPERTHKENLSHEQPMQNLLNFSASRAFIAGTLRQ